MADPKIKYDIEANVTGEASVTQLEKVLRDLGGVLEGDLKTKALESAKALQDLGAKQEAITTFKNLLGETRNLGSAMDVASVSVDKLGTELQQASAASRAQVDAQIAAKAAVASAKAVLDEQRAALSALKTEYTGSARSSDDYKTASAQLKQTIVDLRENLAQQKETLTVSNKAVKEAATAERVLTAEYNAAASAAKNISVELGTKNRALEVSRAAIKAVGIETTGLSQAEQNLKTAIATARQEAEKLLPPLKAAEQQGAAVGNSLKTGFKQAADAADVLGQKIDTVKDQFIAFTGINIGTGMAKDAIATADAFKNLQARIKLTTGEGESFTAAFGSVVDIAKRTSSNLEQTGELFGKLTEAGRSAGLSTQAAIGQSLRLTETINQAIQLSGGSAESAKASITQLVQGLQSGVLRGDEFNSVMEQSPRLAKALADGLNVTTGELRTMAEAGALSSSTVIKALKSQADTLKSEFSTLPATVGRAVENMQTQWMLYIGELDKSKGITTTVARGLNLLSDNLTQVLDTARAAGLAWTGYTAAQKLMGDGAAQAATKITTIAAASTQTAIAAKAVAVAEREAAGAIAAQGIASANATVATKGHAAALTATSTAAASIGTGGFGAALSGVVSKLGALGIASYAGYESIKFLGTAIGEGAAKLMGYRDADVIMAEQLKKEKQATAEATIAREKQTAANEAAIAKSFDLSKAATNLTGKFDGLVKGGDSASEAIGKIGKDFDLSNIPGVKTAASVLDKLSTDGKITAKQFQEAWATALKGEDLAAFEVKAKAAFAGTSREAERLAQVAGAQLQEAVRRTGLDFDVISGGMGRASKSAINDTEAIITGLDRLKAQGVDTAQALTASIGKGIGTADSQKAIEAVKQQIESVRKALGDKVADGLLDQARLKATELSDALDKAKPGINSLREAMKELGLKTREELEGTATKATQAYDTIKSKGQQEGESYVAWQLRKSDAAKVMLERIITLNGGVADEGIKARASMEGLEIAVDGAGRATVKSMNDGKAATDGLATSANGASGAVRDIGQSAQMSAEKMKELEAAIDAVNSKYGQGKADRDGKYGLPGEGKGNSVLTKDDMKPVDNTGLYDLQQKQRAGTLSKSDLAQAEGVYKAAVANVEVYQKNSFAFSTEGAKSILEAANAARILLAQVKAATVGQNTPAANPAPTATPATAPATAPAPAPTPSPTPAPTPSPAPSPVMTNHTYTVNIAIGGGKTTPVEVASESAAKNLITALQDAQRQAGY